MSAPIITALYAGLAGLIYLWLTWSVIVYRRSGKVSLGDGDDPKMAKSIRGQGNAAEYSQRTGNTSYRDRHHHHGDRKSSPQAGAAC